MERTRKPVSFIATDDPDTAEAFYAQIMDLTLIERSDFALVLDDGGHLLRIQIVPEHVPVGHTVYGWQVRDMTKEAKALRAQGVELTRFDQLNQDADGIWTTPEGHKIAWFKDPSGNILSLTEYV